MAGIQDYQRRQAHSLFTAEYPKKASVPDLQGNPARLQRVVHNISKDMEEEKT